jgi:hypothetical protein
MINTSVLAQTAETKCHKLDHLPTTEIYSLQFWRPKVSDKNTSFAEFSESTLSGPLLTDVDSQLFIAASLGTRKSESSLRPTKKALIPFVRAPPLWSDLFPNLHHLRKTQTFGKHTHLVCNKLPQNKTVLSKLCPETICSLVHIGKIANTPLLSFWVNLCDIGLNMASSPGSESHAMPPEPLLSL